jgi:SsrA-binding protein
MSKQKFTNIDITNKKAAFSYELIEKFTAGIIITGTEIKAIREGKANLSDAYCIYKEGELWIRNLHISEYKMGTYSNHEPLRVRKLLLTKKELNKLAGKVKEKGLTIIAYKLFINERGFAKIEIYIAKGKKSHDKRQSLKEKDSKLEMSKALKKVR